MCARTRGLTNRRLLLRMTAERRSPVAKSIQHSGDRSDAAWHPRMKVLRRTGQSEGRPSRSASPCSRLGVELAGLDAAAPRERALDIFGRFGSERSFAVPEKTFDLLRTKPFFSDRELLWKLTHVEQDATTLIG